jgi:CMP-N-acetylneuraminic acid synthetase
MLGGKPLLFWSIDVALTSECFSEICISSESDAILNLVRETYSEEDVKTIKRSRKLAEDHADLGDVSKHFLEKFPEIEYLFLLMPTYPFRRSRRILDEILPPLYSRQIDRVVSVLPGNLSTFDYWIPEGNSYRRMFNHAPLWCGVGNAAYSLMRRDYFFKEPQKWPYLLGERTLRIQTDYTEAIDIDTHEDFQKAEMIVQGYKLEKRQLRNYQDQTHEIVTPEGIGPVAFKQLLVSEGIDLNLPALILTSPPPFFTFLRWYECNNSREYYAESTNKIIAKLPKGGQSQDFPPHYIHSGSYRILRLEEDREGIQEEFVPQEQIIFEDRLKKWKGYVEPFYWVKSDLAES